MWPSKEREIMNDLEKFSQGKECCDRIGKAWKPAGHRRVHHDRCDGQFPELRRVLSRADNGQGRHGVEEAPDRDVGQVRHRDRGQRNKNEKKDNNHGDWEADPVKKMAEEEQKSSKVTPSGLLNFIDGIWSACGAERIIAFTTDCIDKLNPALIRRGRMDKPTEMSHCCCFKAFEVLARDYLDVERHPLFATVAQLLEEADMTPADVAENLMPKSDGQDAVEACGGGSKAKGRGRSREENLNGGSDPAQTPCRGPSPTRPDPERERPFLPLPPYENASAPESCARTPENEFVRIADEREKDSSVAALVIS
ncbi:hypothetical protein NL676_014736 [Syzygium grande]|nr:hypothetical protein NL676_014736 [Syzygium grande]